METNKYRTFIPEVGDQLIWQIKVNIFLNETISTTAIQSEANLMFY